MRKNWLRRGPSACERSPTVARPRRRTILAVHRASSNFKPLAHEQDRLLLRPHNSEWLSPPPQPALALARILGYFKRPMLPVSTGSGTRGCAGQFRKCAPLFLIASLTACAGTPIVTAMPNSCATLLPQEWKQGVAGAPLPDGDTVGDWVAFADQQTGKLDIANDRTKSAIGIVERCEERDRQAVARATRHKILGLF